MEACEPLGLGVLNPSYKTFSINNPKTPIYGDRTNWRREVAEQCHS